MNIKNKRDYFLPLILTFAVIAFDQLTKWLIITSIAPWSVGASFFGDLIRIVCVYNTGAAFSLGSGLSSVMRFIVMACIPACFIAGICVVYFKSEFPRLQRWFLSGIIGGGISNLLDRFFRAEGVVDFIDVKFFGLFGLERWPTFNVADSAIVICGAGLFIALFIQEWKGKSKTPAASKDGE
ncbi:signal peptidase II [Treponema sp. OMZ 857]|uniref:signal peptidase II n=1 Tax=Treponema sp. OMZ 857 TaxID=1643513 RepID=UPI0020A548AD|nr:signal peptidase II [Treponema sp. OMZ 857]UTC43060.1 signal peptidase II [Treponema sp. OMZ 857]